MPTMTLPLEHLLRSTDPADFSARRQLSNVSSLIAKAKRVVVVSGAGISCSSGIPDFRSADGLYALVKSRYPDAFFTGKDLFSSGLFSNPQTTSLFYTFIAELSLACSAAQPTKTHHFIHKLEKTGKLLRSYTQNVDGLERRLGLESGGRGKGLKKKGTRNVELHGDLGRVRCVLCFADYPARKEWVELFREGEAPECPACAERCASRVKRSARATAVGTLRPAIVLYDEPHPFADDIGAVQTYDLARQPDVLLIMGTSLKVHGLKRLVKEFAKSAHTPTASGKKGTVIFVNSTRPAKEWEGVIDVHVHGTTDMWVEKVEEEWRRIRPGDWEVQTKLDGEMGLAQAVVKEVEKGKAKAKVKNEENDTLFTAGQLPTPRPSQSPPKSPFVSLSTCRPSAFPSSPLQHAKSVDAFHPITPAAPHTPLSPGKRRANVSQTESELSSSKRNKIAAPCTGLQSTPGRGNLFPSSQMVSAIPAGGDDEVFGTPKAKVGNLNGAENRRTRKASKHAATGKENVEADEKGGVKTAAGVRIRRGAVMAALD